MIYLAIDPGVVTGVAVWAEGERIQTYEYDDLAVVAHHVSLIAKRSRSQVGVPLPEGVTVITEKFIISARTIKGKVFYESLYFNGWLAIEYPDRIEQTAAQAKRFATDAKLKHMGWFTPSKDGHANDAARHLLYRTVKNREPYVLDRLKEMT